MSAYVGRQSRSSVYRIALPNRLSGPTYERTYGRTYEEPWSPTRYQETSVTRAPAYGISPIDEHRARQASKGATA